MTQDSQDNTSSLEARVEELEASLVQSNGELTQSKAEAGGLRRQSAKYETEVADLREQLNAKKLLTETIMHDFRAPLAGAFGFAELSLEALDKDKPLDELRVELRNNLNTIYDAARHMESMITNLHNLMNPTYGVMLLDTDLYLHVVRHCISRLDLKVNYEPETLPSEKNMVYTDQFITRDIILPNLLKNAVNHGGKNTSITVGYRLRDGRQELYVRNTGSCFTNGDKKDMFEPFKKDPRSKGLGLGLNICKRYAELMGGYLRAESSGQPSDGNMQNAWAEFSLGFPVKP